MAFNFKARGAMRVPGTMNKTETQYSQHLSLRRHAGDIEAFWFEGMTLKLAQDTRYTPDFVVLRKDGFIEMHDTKGAKKILRKDGSRETVAYSQEDSKLKIKVAAEMFPFRFVFVFFDKALGSWVEREF